MAGFVKSVFFVEFITLSLLQPFAAKDQAKNPHYWTGFCYKTLTMTYFHTREPALSLAAVSLSCSGWERVGPPRYGHQA